MEISAGTFEVLATSGDVELGGVDMDNALINYVVNDFKTKENFDISKDNVAMQRIRDAVEKAKIELSTVLETEINLPYITVANNAPKNLDIKISRATLENLVRPIIEKSRQPILNVLKDAGIEKEKVSKIILVGGPTRMPIVQKFLIDMFGDKLEKGVDPMEAVALGAAIQGAVLAGDIKDIVLLDVTPLTLSIETLGGVSTPIIERNSTIPIKASKVFSTADDYQTSVTINVIQGERPLARDNISLGSFNLEGIPPAPRGVPQIEVTFDIDANGILSVSAKDKATGKTQKITISAPHKLSKEEIEKMMQAAKENEENDKKIKELIEAKNNISALSYSLEKTLNDFKDKITDEEKNEADEIIKKIKEDTAKEDVTLDQINEDKDKLTAVINKLSSKIYSQKDQSAPGAEQQGPQNDENNGTQDGEGNSES
jgi:molecular chaperone DnaK